MMTISGHTAQCLEEAQCEVSGDSRCAQTSYFVRSGRVYSGYAKAFYNAGMDSGYWSSFAIFSSGVAYGFVFNSSGVNPSDNYNGYPTARSLRCLASQCLQQEEGGAK